MRSVHLHDFEFCHQSNPSGEFSLTDFRKPSFYRYAGNSNIHFFTDKAILKCTDSLCDWPPDAIKIAWVIETRETFPEIYSSLERNFQAFDYVLTYDADLLNRVGRRGRFYPFGGCWVNRSSYGLKEKSKNICMVYSNKNYTTGHNLRHKIANLFGEKIETFGSGCGRSFDETQDEMTRVLSPYRFCVTVENTKNDYYFSEKLLNAIACGCVPVYWGARNISEFFDDSGILSFDTVDDLKKIINEIEANGNSLYENMLGAIKKNISLVLEYDIPEDWIFKNFLSKEKTFESWVDGYVV